MPVLRARAIAAFWDLHATHHSAPARLDDRYALIRLGRGNADCQVLSAAAVQHAQYASIAGAFSGIRAAARAFFGARASALVCARLSAGHAFRRCAHKH
jgi:hypothetical protein